MERKLLPLLSVLTLLLVAVGGTVAVDASTTPSGEELPDEATAHEPKTTPNTTDHESSDGHVWIPEDQNHDGEIDERFRNNDSNDSEADAGICLVGADSPCNEESADQPGSEPIESRNTSEDSQIWIPEDQNRDGVIDDRFRSDSVVGALMSMLFSVAGNF